MNDAVESGESRAPRGRVAGYVEPADPLGERLALRARRELHHSRVPLLAERVGPTAEVRGHQVVLLY